MNNAELIKALREAKKHFWTQPQIELYPMMEAAADALEAAEKRIAELERIMKAVQENSGINFRMWQEAEAQLPKEGEWIDNGNGTYSCNRCGSWIPNEQHFYARYCLYCGAKMQKGEQE